MVGETNQQLLARVPLFAELSEPELERISQVAGAVVPWRVACLPLGRPRRLVLHRQDGVLRVTREHSDGRAITLANLGGRRHLRRTRDARRIGPFGEREALEDAELLAFPPAMSSRFSPDHPEMAVKLVEALIRRLREANERISHQSFRTVPRRVAGVLIQLLTEERPARRGER